MPRLLLVRNPFDSFLRRISRMGAMEECMRGQSRLAEKEEVLRKQRVFGGQADGMTALGIVD
jgi:hypothetical protein